jgi:putative salt-induced outer membrane protein YdiY
MNRKLPVALFVSAVFLVGVDAARAQQAPASFLVTPTVPTAAQAAAPAQAQAPARKWHGNASLGVALATGVQAQEGYKFSLGIKRPFSDGGNFVAQFSRDYSKVTFPSQSLLSDRTAASLGADVNVTKHTVAMVRTMFLEDGLQYVDSRFEQLAGYGLHLFDADKRFVLQLVPGISVFKQDLAYSDVLDWEAGWGIFEKFTGKINDAWSIENTFRYRHNFTDVDNSIEATASLNGMITKTLGLQMEYQYNHESIVPPGFPNYLSVLSAGLRFQF